MTTYPYQPPARELESVITAFRDFELANTWSVRVEPDPLGPVNRIVRLMRWGTQVAAVLARVPEGADVRLVRDEGSITIREVFDHQQRIWAAREVGGYPVDIEAIHPPGWRVEVDDETVLSVTDAEIAPKPPQLPPKPFWVRVRRWVSTRTRSAVDGLAGRYGYRRDDGCGWDE